MARSRARALDDARAVAIIRSRITTRGCIPFIPSAHPAAAPRREEVDAHSHDQHRPADRDDPGGGVHQWKRRSRSDELTTETLDSAIASDASMGWSPPVQPRIGPMGPPGLSNGTRTPAAIGMPRVL